jgi:hypothetical protein
MNNLPQNIKLTIHGEEIEFSLTDKREIKYYGKTETSNESLWRTDKLEDNEVFYQTEWGWGVFVKIEERELSLEEKCDWLNKNYPAYGLEEWTVEKLSDNDYLKEVEFEYNISTKLITITYKDTKIECYE